MVCIDPVDGSSNLDINGIVGTIFSVRRRRGAGREAMAADAVQPGSAQVAAGYIMYGPSTVLVYTAGQGVHGFTLEPTIGEFIHSHEDIRIPGRGRIYSVNDGNAPLWQPGIGRYVEYLSAHDKATGRPYTARYVGSMVADIHRTLLEGGIFLYPAVRGRRRPGQRQAPTAVRGRAHGLPRGAGGRPGQHGQRAHPRRPAPGLPISACPS